MSRTRNATKKRGGASIDFEEDGPIQKKICSEQISGNLWVQLLIHLSSEFEKLENKPLNDWFLIPKGASNVDKVSASVINSKRYIPQMLQEMGVEVINQSELSNGDIITAIYDKIKGIRGAQGTIESRFGLKESANQVVPYSGCFAINFNRANEGHGWTKQPKPPSNDEDWPPMWFKTTALSVMKEHDDSLSVAESMISFGDDGDDGNEHDPNSGSIEMSKSSKSKDNLTSSTVSPDFLRYHNSESRQESKPTETIAEFKADEGSFVSQEFQKALQLYKPRLAGKTLKTRKNEKLQWTDGGVSSSRNTIGSNKKDILCMLHTLSHGQLNNAKEIIRSVIEDTQMESQLFDKSSSLDSGIVSSMQQTISSFGTSRKKETQQFIDSVVTSSVCYLEDEFSATKVGKRLGVSTNSLKKANAASKSLRELKSYSHGIRKQRKDSHLMTGAIECIVDYCHGEFNAIRVESNESKPISVGNNEYHTKRVWDGVVTQDEKYEDFLQSDEYLTWRVLHPTTIIGKNSFIRNICKCVKDPTQEDCVDLIYSDLNLAMNAVRKVVSKKVKGCLCTYHSQFSGQTSLQWTYERMPFENLLSRSINYLVAYTCCPARRFDDLKCGIGSTACNPKFIPFACVSTDESNRCKKCGVSDMQNDVLQCPIFCDDISQMTISRWQSVVVSGCTQNEVRTITLSVKDSVRHLFTCLARARRHCVLSKWTRHARKLEQVMGDALRNRVFCTDFMATANFQSILRDNSAIDSHAMNAIFIVYCNWKKVLYARMYYGFSTYDTDPSKDNDWVAVDMKNLTSCFDNGKQIIHDEVDVKEYHFKTRPPSSKEFGLLKNRSIYRIKNLDEDYAGPQFHEDAFEAMDGDSLEFGIYSFGSKEYGWGLTDNSEWIIVDMEYDISFSEITIDVEEPPVLIDKEKIPLHLDWVWVESDECIVNETHCFHYVGGSETSNKDNNHQYDNACTRDLISCLGKRSATKFQEDTWKLPAAVTENSPSTTRNERMEDEEDSTEMEYATNTPQDISNLISGVPRIQDFDGIKEIVFYAIKNGVNLDDINIVIKDTKYSDNCAAQYKNRHSAMETAHANDLDEKTIRSIRFALKYCFKGNWDGEGKVFKWRMRQAEMKGIRIHDSLNAYYHGKKELTKSDYHKSWSNISPCDKNYIVSSKHDLKSHNEGLFERKKSFESKNVSSTIEFSDSMEYHHENLPRGGFSIRNATYSSPANEKLKYRAEGTGSGFSLNVIHNAPAGTIYCSDESILNKRINSLDTRTFSYATCVEETFFELASKHAHSKSIVFVDRRDEVKPDPGEGKISGIKSYFEMSGSTSSRNGTDPESKSSYNLTKRGMYCSCSICRDQTNSNRGTCQHLQSMSDLGIGHVQQLSNESKVEWYRCFCCGKQICTYEQALRHSVRKECDGMKDVQWSDGDAKALREIFETSIALCKGRDNTDNATATMEVEPEVDVSEVEMQEEAVENPTAEEAEPTEADTIPRAFYTPFKQLKRVEINLPTSRISNELDDFGMEINDECSDNVGYPLLASIKNSSPCHGKIRLDHKSWILSINKQEMKTKRDILEMLNGVEKQLDFGDAFNRVAAIHESSKSKKKDYTALANILGVKQLNRNKKVDELKDQILQFLEEKRREEECATCEDDGLQTKDFTLVILQKQSEL